MIKSENEKAFEINTIVPIKLDLDDNFLNGRILTSEQNTFLEVDFGDGTFSTDMQTSDVIDYDIRKYGLPQKGSNLQVKWDDNSEYTCIFLGSNESYIYEVRIKMIYFYILI